MFKVNFEQVNAGWEVCFYSKGLDVWMIKTGIYIAVFLGNYRNFVKLYFIEKLLP